MGTLASLVGASVINAREVIFLGLIDAVRDVAGDPDTDEADLLASLRTLFDFAQHVRHDHQVPDPMGPGWNRPAPATQHEVVTTLINAAAHVGDGDSFEGIIAWSVFDDEDDRDEVEIGEYGLIARYRIGNRDGQGGLRVFTGEDSTPRRRTDEAEP